MACHLRARGLTTDHHWQLGFASHELAAVRHLPKRSKEVVDKMQRYADIANQFIDADVRIWAVVFGRAYVGHFEGYNYGRPVIPTVDPSVDSTGG